MCGPPTARCSLYWPASPIAALRGCARPGVAMSPKRQRLLFVIGSVLALSGAVLFTLSALRDNIVFFYAPSDMRLHPEAVQKRVRLGGLVKAGSVEKQPQGGVVFIVTDGKADIIVHYNGVLPALFREGQGVVAEGILQGERFEASQLLAKHDERYMPKEVADKLKATGRWRGSN